MVARDPTSLSEALAELRRRKNPVNIAGMARFGISAKHVLGISTPELQAMAKRIGRDHSLAGQLWKTGIYEARLLAALVAHPHQLTRRQANAWAADFENWADCDGVCLHLLRKTPFAHDLAVTWSQRKAEFVKRAGFTMMATLAVHDKAAPDAVFLDYLSRVEAAAHDERNGVKKAVNWALRQIGKRSASLLVPAIRTAERIRKQETKSARWIASDALRELGRRRKAAE
jgi:3-methyladenine DNA glycosylase AlkD